MDTPTAVSIARMNPGQLVQVRNVVRRVIEEWASTVLLNENGACMPMEGFENELARILCQLETIHGPGDAAEVISEVFSVSHGANDAFLPENCLQVGEEFFKALIRCGAFRPADSSEKAARSAVASPFSL